jgi:ferrous iron transport protein A
LIPLSMVGNAKTVQIVNIAYGRGLRQKLLAMGVVPGSIWHIAQNAPGGPIVLQKDGIRIGIGFGMSNKIFVRIIQ